MRSLKSWAAAATMVALSGAAQAALVSRAGGTMIYDSVRDITWLADMNYAFSSGYATANAGGAGSHTVLQNGLMGWDAANTWANNLVYGGYSDWRLPTLNPLDTSCSGSRTPIGFPTEYLGFNCTGGELSGLLVTELGYNNIAQSAAVITSDDTAEQIANLALFSPVRTPRYWSGTEYVPNTSEAWYIDTIDGYQRSRDKFTAMFAVAVRSGDVAATVPEPQSLVLALLALGVAVMVRKRKPR
jgi:hypothetical protein